jgi:hypothetical protein
MATTSGTEDREAFLYEWEYLNNAADLNEDPKEDSWDTNEER